MAWNLGIDKNSSQLKNEGSSTTKQNLEMGDLVIVNLQGGKHVIIFVEWADAGMNSYIGYDCGSSKGVSKR